MNNIRQLVMCEIERDFCKPEYIYFPVEVAHCPLDYLVSNILGFGRKPEA